MCAFLNTRGGIVIFGVKEEGTGSERRYRFTGWQPQAEPHLKEIQTQFANRAKTPLDLKQAFPPPTIRPFMGGAVALFFVDELPADEKHVFYRGEAGSHVSIQNPGSFRGHLLVERVRGLDNPIPIHRILPEAKPQRTLMSVPLLNGFPPRMFDPFPLAPRFHVPYTTLTVRFTGTKD